MALEIKGLKAKALRMRQNIDALNHAYDAFNEKAPAHVSDVNALVKQVDELNSDLGFAATTLGNSTEQSSGEEQPNDQSDSSKPATSNQSFNNLKTDLEAAPKRMNFL